MCLQVVLFLGAEPNLAAVVGTAHDIPQVPFEHYDQCSFVATVNVQCFQLLKMCRLFWQAQKLQLDLPNPERQDGLQGAVSWCPCCYSLFLAGGEPCWGEALHR